MPPHNFTDTQAATVVAYLRNMATLRTGAAPTVLRGVGDAARGKALFEGKGQCATCHRVNGKGPRMAPDLSEVGATRPLPELHQALLDPNATMRAGNRSFQVVTKDGTTMHRTIVQSGHLLDSADRRQRSAWSRCRNRICASMDSSRRRRCRRSEGKLTLQEVDDLVGYLVTLKGLSQ